MDKNQLLSDLARAVEAAKPAQEYCFLWIDWWATCMTKAEWSGWMQAIFSVIAIIAAAVLAWWQLRAVRKTAEISKEKESLELASVALQICERVHRLASNTDRDVFSKKISPEWFERLEHRWVNLLVCLDILLTKNMDAEVLKIVFDSRGFSAAALSACKMRNVNAGTTVGMANIFDIKSSQWNTTVARWNLRKLIRERRKKLNSL